MTPANSANNEKPVVKGQASSPSKPMSSSRAAASSSAKPNKPVSSGSKPTAEPVKKPAKSIRPSAASSPSSSAEFCKGWTDGYVKGWNLNKKQQEKPRVPNCVVSKDCKDYKCGYKMGMKRAETDNRK
jgi:hypothetical protein